METFELKKVSIVLPRIKKQNIIGSKRIYNL